MDEYRRMGNTNAFNLAMEYLNNPRQAADRYSGTAVYDKTVGEIEEALAKKVEQKVRLTAKSCGPNSFRHGVSTDRKPALVHPQ